MSHDIGETNSLVSAVTSWELDEAGVEHITFGCLDADTRWNSSWVEIIILFATVVELNFCHELTSDIVVKCSDTVVARLKHQILPEILGRVLSSDVVVLLDSLS